jgi:hypothetical protein
MAPSGQAGIRVVQKNTGKYLNAFVTLLFKSKINIYVYTEARIAWNLTSGISIPRLEFWRLLPHPTG